MLRSSFSTSLLHGLATAILLSSATVADGWVGYMNVFNNAAGSQGGFVFGNSWGLSDVKTTVITSNPGTIVGDQLRLQPNFNAYTDALTGTDANRAFWTDSTDLGVTAGPNGNKWMEANSFSETASIAVPSYTLQGTVDSNILDPTLYSAEAFIKVLNPSAGFATVLNDRISLPLSGPFTVTSDLSLYQGMTLQTGFTVNGLNANPVNEIAYGSVELTVVPEPSTIGLAMAGLAGLAGIARRPRVRRA